MASLLRPADQGRSLLGAALLRLAVADHLGVEPTEVVVDRTCGRCGGQHGAPRILGPGSSCPWVSVSHSGLLVVVAVAPDGPVGVDVQRLSELSDPDGGQDWACREALVKAGGSGAAGWTGAESTADDPGPVEPTGDCRELRPPLPGYVAVLATPGRAGVEPVVRHWPERNQASFEGRLTA
ncbi:4'-phosphopantetheinyl transferase family protein [Raineyella antarctica]|uniref:4'-phosphopantetheinyl transferase family protein n=1 Tax=Raineyella antarctica TaxID=1577474 RepID=UPI000B8A1172|nr:hypothetical protein [Raineyella antarctica]